MVEKPNPESKDSRFSVMTEIVLQSAKEEAQRLSRNYIGTEHLLLGISLLPDEEIAKRVLEVFGLNSDKVRNEVELLSGRGDIVVMGEPILTPRAKQVIDLAVAEANKGRPGKVEPEHVLTGLILEGEGLAVAILETLGLNAELVIATLARLKTGRRLAQLEGQLKEDAELFLEKLQAFLENPLIAQGKKTVVLHTFSNSVDGFTRKLSPGNQE